MIPHGQITLQEYEECEIDLDPGSARDLATVCENKLDLTPAGAGDRWRLTATQWVGSIVLPELTIMIRPKIRLENLFLLLGVGMPASAWRPETYSYGEIREILPAFAAFFARTLETALARGLIRNYRDEWDRLPGLRGRIDLVAQFRSSGLNFPLHCRFQEYSSDIPENQILKAATTKLLRVFGVPEPARRALMRERTRFEEVTDREIAHELSSRVIFTRLNEHYRAALRLADIVLRNVTLIDRAGSTDASAFLIDMNDLFQEFVTDRLRSALRGVLTVESESTQWLGVTKKVEMYPDLAFRRRAGNLYVADIKYKLTATGRARNADYYQLLAYTTAMGLEEGLLIYCQADGPVPPSLVEVRFGGQQLRTYAIDLSGPTHQVELSLRQLADWIRRRVLELEGSHTSNWSL